MSKSDFLVSAILGTLGCYCAEEFYKCGVLGAVHYVGNEGFGDVNEFGCFVGVKVGLEVGALADCCSCGLDGVVEEVATLIVCKVVGFFYLASEVVAEDLLEVLSVVGVCSFDVGECDGFHSG